MAMETEDGAVSSNRTLMLLGGDPALDLMNTIVGVEAQAQDLWQSGADVLHWLVHSQWLDAQTAERAAASLSSEQLLTAARTLREDVRALVLARKQGQVGDVERLNRHLRVADSHEELQWPDGAAAPRIARRYHWQTAEQLLAPLAEAAARLLADGEFTLVRKCENPQCSQWFYDRTKAHKRRWCSMAVCGNRHKVAAFRKRHQD